MGGFTMRIGRQSTPSASIPAPSWPLLFRREEKDYLKSIMAKGARTKYSPTTQHVFSQTSSRRKKCSVQRGHTLYLGTPKLVWFRSTESHKDKRKRPLLLCKNRH